MTCVDRLVLVYDADGGLRGELAYVARKALGGPGCSLCDVTHGLSLRERPAFRRCRERLRIRIDLRHRNELSDVERHAATDAFPAVLVEAGGATLRLLGPEELAPCAGDVEAFEAAVRGALARRGLTLD